MKHLLLLLALAACARGTADTTLVGSTARLPAPTEVVVTGFAVQPQQVRLDSGIGAVLSRAVENESTPQALLQAGQTTQRTLTDTLVQRLTAYGLPATTLPPGGAPPAGALIVQGQITAINEGNRIRRTLIGLGAGQSSLSGAAQLYYAADPAHPLFLRSFDGEANSGHMPGAAETMGAGAAAGRLATSAAMTAGTHAADETHGTDDAANARELGEALAKRIGDYAAGQGWISPQAVQ